MNITRSDKPALLLIDIQKGFEDVVYWGGQRNNPMAEANAAEILQLWRQHGLPVFHIQHCSTNPISPLHESNAGNAFNELVVPVEGETIIKKNVNSAFIGTDLQEQLKDAGIKKLVIAGLTTDHCISTTTRMAGNMGFETYLVADACATFNKTGMTGENYPAELIHETALASLHKEFAEIITTDLMKKVFAL